MSNRSAIPKAPCSYSSANSKPLTTLLAHGRAIGARPSATVSSAFQRPTSSQSLQRQSAATPLTKSTTKTKTAAVRRPMSTSSSNTVAVGDKLRPASSVYRVGPTIIGASRAKSDDIGGGLRSIKPAALRSRVLSTVSKSRDDEERSKAILPQQPQQPLVVSKRQLQLEDCLNALRAIIIVRQWEQRRERDRLSEMKRMHNDLSLKFQEVVARLTAKCDELVHANAQLETKAKEDREWRIEFERRNADECATLTRRADDTQTALESARIENCRLADEMATARVEHKQLMQKLTDDLVDLQFIVDQKTEDARKLRAENLQLQLNVDELHEAKVEARKLRIRLDETTEQLKRQQDLQKELVHQVERCREETQNSINISRIKEQENEVLKYKLQYEFTPLTGGNDRGDGGGRVVDDFNSCWRSLTCSTPLTSRSVRSSVPNTPRRSHSVSGQRHASILDDGMVSMASESRTPLRQKSGVIDTPLHKSLDVTSMSALSIFQTEGRRATRNTPSKIYAPDGTIEGLPITNAVFAKQRVSFEDRYRLRYRVHDLSLLENDYLNKDDEDVSENNNSYQCVDFDATAGSDL